MVIDIYNTLQKIQKGIKFDAEIIVLTYESGLRFRAEVYLKARNKTYSVARNVEFDEIFEPCLIDDFINDANDQLTQMINGVEVEAVNWDYQQKRLWRG